MVPVDPSVEVRPSIIEFLKEPLNALPIFVERVVMTSRVDPSSVYLALIYLRRAQMRVRFAVNEHNVHRLFTAALLLAAKFWEDQPLHTKWWSTFTGFTTRLVCRMEEEFISLLDWDLFVRPEEYTDFRLDYEDLIDHPVNPVIPQEELAPAAAAVNDAPGNESSSQTQALQRALTPTALIESETATMSDAEGVLDNSSYCSNLSDDSSDEMQENFRDGPRSAPIVQLMCRDNSSTSLVQDGAFQALSAVHTT